MKKLITIAVLMALSMSGFAQILHYNFSAVCESGQTLYYLITSEEEHTVMLTYPFSEENYLFTGDNYYKGFPEPQGEIILPTIVYYNDTPYSVTAIGDNAFNSCRGLSGTLTIPEGIISIGTGAFRSCGFTSIIIPKSLEVIVSLDNGYGTAFVYCSSLESISVDDENPIFYSENNAIIRRENKTLVVGCKTTTIPDDIETIGRSAFQGSGDGGDLVIPNSVIAIDDYAFYESQFSGAVTFSDSLRYIGIKAFSYCHISGSLTIPNTVTVIGNYAFSDCSHLTGDLMLSSSLSTINKATFKHVGCMGTLIIPNSVHYIKDLAFFFTNFSELVLGDSISTIGRDAFNNIYSDIHLTGVLSLPSSLSEIGTSAFAYTSFDEIHSPNTTPPTLDNNAFYQCDTNTPIHIPFGCIEIYRNTPGWNYFTNFVESEMNLEGEWFYEILNDDGSITYQHLEYAADTTIGTERPKIIVRTNTIYDRDEHTEVTHEYILERDGKVFWWNKDLEEFTTLYDYNAETGDEWEIKVGTESILVHVDSVGVFEYEGDTRKMLHISDADNIFNGDIVVGYGHMISFFPEKLMRRDGGFTINGLRCYWVQDALLYHNGDEDCDAIYSEIHGVDEDGPSTGSGTFVMYPNPANGVLTVSVRLPQCDSPTTVQTAYRITNLMGQTLLTGNISAETQQIDISNLPAGMYFISMNETTQKFVKR